MKKFLFIVTCIIAMAVTSANAQQKKIWYKQADIEGIWLVTEVYNENEKEWQTVGGEDAMAFAFSPVKTEGKYIALFGNAGDTTHFVYTFSNNTVRLYDLNNHSELLITINISSLKRGQNFVGRITTTSSDYGAKFKFTHIDEKEDE